MKIPRSPLLLVLLGLVLLGLFVGLTVAQEHDENGDSPEAEVVVPVVAEVNEGSPPPEVVVEGTKPQGHQEGQPPVHGFDGHAAKKRFQQSHNHPNLTPEQLRVHQERIKAQEEYMKEHQGHDEMHAEMILILFVTLMLSQVLLLVWRKRSPRTHHNATLLGLWFFPAGFSFSWGYWRFLGFWFAFSVLNSYVIFIASRKPLAQGTPRTVYKWFYLMFYVCYGIGALSFTVLLLDLIGIFGLFFDAVVIFQVSLITFYYALYFGVLGRDFADMCSDRMASTLGFYSKDGIPARTVASHLCAICDNQLYKMSSDSSALEKTIVLDCGHSFHEWCIRGWCIIGKKHTCPFCKEKVDLHKFMNNPWEVINVRYSNLLDGLRYLLVYHPLIVLFSRGVIYLLDLK